MPISSITNTSALFSKRSLDESNIGSSTAMAELATGYRTSRASRSTTEMAIGTKIASTVSVLVQATRNAAQGASLVQMGASALKNTTDVLTRMKNLSAQVINGALSDRDKLTASVEFDNLKILLDKIAGQTKWNGTSLLSGNTGNVVMANSGTVLSSGGAAVSGYFNALVGNEATQITGSINGKVAGITVTSLNNGVIQAGTIILALENGEVFTNLSQIYLSLNAKIILTSESNPANSIALSLAPTSATIDSVLGLGGSVTGAVSSGVTHFWDFSGVVSSTGGVTGTYVNCTSSATQAATTANTFGAITMTAMPTYFYRLTVQGNVNLSGYVPGSFNGDMAGTTVTFDLINDDGSSDTYFNENNLNWSPFGDTNVFISNKYGNGRTISIVNEMPTSLDSLNYVTAFDTYLSGCTNFNPRTADGYYPIGSLSVHLTDGNTYSNLSNYIPGGGSLVLSTGTGKSITLEEGFVSVNGLLIPNAPTAIGTTLANAGPMCIANAPLENLNC